MNAAREFDLIIIGGGPAGYSAAVRGSQLGASVLLIEKDAPGGTCLNCGCIPTKFFWEALSIEGKIKKAAQWGLEAKRKETDFSAVQRQKTKLIELQVKGLRRLIESHGIEISEGRARFSGSRSVAVELRDGQTVEFTGKKIIIAAGSRPRNVPGLLIDHEKILDSTDALALSRVPGSLLVIGGGAIGVEMATIFSGFGSRVTVLEKETQLLPGEDPEISAELKKLLERQGIKVVLGQGYTGDMLEQAEKVLVAAGRAPSADALDLERAGIQHTPKGIAVNEYLETNQAGIYAAGDITGQWYLAYAAQEQGMAASENAMGRKYIPDFSAIPRVVFSRPAIASAGIRENDAPKDTLAVGRFPFTANSRAFIEGERAGGVKIIAEKDSGKILGGSIIGAHAEELVATLSIALQHELTVDDLRRHLFFHPSLSETIQSAAEDTAGRCVDLPKKNL